MPIRRIVTSVALMAVVAGCGSSATSAPGAASAPASRPRRRSRRSRQRRRRAAATGGGVQPSFAGDPDLAAKFPKDGRRQARDQCHHGRAWSTSSRRSRRPRIEIDKDAGRHDGDRREPGYAHRRVRTGDRRHVDGPDRGHTCAGCGCDQAASRLAAKLSENDPAPTRSRRRPSAARAYRSFAMQGGYASSWLYAHDDIIWEVNTSSQDEAAAVFSGAAVAPRRDATSLRPTGRGRTPYATGRTPRPGASVSRQR